MYTASIKKINRQFLPENFTLHTWEAIEPYFIDLVNRAINDLAALELWLSHLSELEAVVSEDACWRQIKMTCDTENKTLEEAFNFYCMEIAPKIQPYADQINKKLIAHPLVHELKGDAYATYLRGIRKSIELFRTENIPLQAEVAVLQQHFGVITGKMTVQLNNQEYTLQQAAKFLENPDRTQREAAYRAIQEKRLESKDELNQLFSQLLEKRNQEALNAGFENYRDYRFKELGRFDYTKADCFAFHEAVKLHVLPLVNAIYQRKKDKLQLDSLRPWDIDAEPAGTKPLQPFSDSADLIEKTIRCFNRLRPFFGDCLKKMTELKHLDLESRKGKAPGGYNCPLAESGAPFIFMNAAGQMNDVITMVHEGGHAVHSFLAHPLPLNGFKEYPMEIAEVASMSMELFTIDYWDEFFKDSADLQRAKIQHLEKVITIFPWIAIVDKFQHWIYENPTHSLEERTENWVRILNEFSDDVIDYSGLEAYRANHWQKQLHLFEVPFYYIEYGIAQLGAIGMWMQYCENADQALNNYCAALSLGGTKTLPELYATAGLSFDFSPEKIRVLMEFIQTKMNA
ncbi:MAG: M3 family oligoendopeptidase [Ferruginibacter sp.]